MEQYVLKYDKQDKLYCYLETNKKGKVLSYYNLKDNRLLRYDSVSKYCSLTEYCQKCKMMQRFEASESWITVTIDSVEYNLSHYNIPKKKKEFSVKNSNILNFTVSQEFLKKHKNNVYITCKSDNLIQFSL